MAGSRRIAFALCLLSAMLWLQPVRTRAQDSLSFSTIELSTGLFTNRLQGELSRHWRGTPGVLLQVLTPYGPGALRLSVEASRQWGRSAGLPDYLVVFPSLEWGLDRRLVGPIRGIASAGLGALWMRFAGVTNPSETELGVTATVELRGELGRGWSLGAGARTRRILLAQPVTQPSAFVSLGFRRSLHSPLRRALVGEGVADTLSASVPSGAGAALEPGGVRRLSELFRALPGWDETTVDHRTSWATPDGLSAPLESSPYILIDGLLLPQRELGGVTLDLLPLALEEVDSVRSAIRPGLVHGRFLDRGALDIRTAARAQNGVEVFASALAENPTGDPGPFLFTDSTAGNVDKLGSGFTVGARWRAGPIAGSAGFRENSDVVTDPHLAGRTLSLRDPRIQYPVMQTRVGWVALRADGSRGTHDFRAGRGRRSDYAFLPALGFELPTETTLTYVGGTGRAQLTRGLSWEYGAYGAGYYLDPDVNDLGLAFDLSTRTSSAQSALTVGTERTSLSLGAGIDRKRVESPLLPSRLTLLTRRGWMSATTGLGATDVGLEAEVRSTDGETGSRWKVHGATSIEGSSALRWEAWHLRLAPVELDGFWGLHARGYEFLQTADVATSVGAVGGRVESGAFVQLDGTQVGALELSPFVRGTRVDGVIVERPSFTPGARRPVHEDPVVVSRSGPGEILAAGIQASWRPGERFETSLRYRWLDAISGDALVREAWQSFPAHRLQQSLLWRARADLRIGLDTEASSATRWVGYEALGVDRLRGRLRLDGWIEKSLWEGRFTLQGRLLNLLDREVPLHPLGAAPGLALSVAGAARLGR